MFCPSSSIVLALLGEFEARCGGHCLILDGVKADRWRILVGLDAERLDELVRQSPERAYQTLRDHNRGEVLFD